LKKTVSGILLTLLLASILTLAFTFRVGRAGIGVDYAPYNAVIWAWDNVHGWLVEPIIMDGSPTNFTTPYNFTGLTTSHTFTVPSSDGFGNSFGQWYTGETSTTIMVASDGIYTAQYFAPYLNVTVGVNTAVTPTLAFNLTFANVITAGFLIANVTPTVHAPPLLNQVGQYYDINVNATYSGGVSVSLAFDGSGMTQQQKSSLTMVQYTPILGDVATPYGRVDMKDIAAVAFAFGSRPGIGNWNPNCDINGDGKVDMKDIAMAAAHFGTTATWVNITTHVDTANNIIYGSTTHFSFIGIH